MIENRDLKPMSLVLNDLKDKGYAYDFQVCEGGFICKDNGQKYQPEELMIMKIYRFEGESNPDDMAVVYTIEADDGTKGILLDAFGTYSDPYFGEYIKRVKIHKDAN